MAGNKGFLPAAAAGTALAAARATAGGLADFAGSAGLAGSADFGGASGTGLETGLTADSLRAGFPAAGFLSAGLVGAAALTADSAGFLATVLVVILAPAADWAAWMMGLTAVLSGVFGFTGGFAVALTASTLTTGALPAGFWAEAACGRPCAACAAGPCDGAVWVFWSARDCSGSAGRRDAVKPNRWRTDLNIKLHCAFWRFLHNVRTA